MKIWLNHTLACPDDASYPFRLIVLQWESEEDQFKELLDGFRTKILYNFRNEESPLTIEIIKETSENDLIAQNLNQLRNESGIIHLIEKNDKILLYDANVIEPLPIRNYIRFYTDILEEFAFIKDHSKTSSAINAFQVVSDSIYSTIRISLENSMKIQSGIGHIEKFLGPILQELLFLNIYLTYLEIKEGLLVCPHCKRWFPIIKTIPRIYPKTMKRQELDLEFLNKWRDLYPADVVMD